MKIMEELRLDIDEIDNELLTVLGKRKKVITLIAEYKSKHHMDIKDSGREKQLLNDLLEKAKLNDLDTEFVTELYDVILKNSRKEQKKIK